MSPDDAPSFAASSFAAPSDPPLATDAVAMQEHAPPPQAAGGLLGALARARQARAAPAPSAPPVVVEQRLSATEIFGRRDVVVRARIAAGAAEVALFVEDRLAGRVLLPAGREAGPGPHVAIQAARPAADAGRRLPMKVVVRAADGLATEAQATLALDAKAAVLGLPSASAEALRDFAPPVMLYVERAMIDPAGLLVVHGWALGRQPVATVQVLADGTPVGAARLGVHRPDVAKIFPAYRDAGLGGFSFAAPVSGLLGEAWRDVATVTVLAITREGASQSAALPAEHAAGAAKAALTSRVAPKAALTASGPAEAESGRIQLFCDSAEIALGGRVSVSGWAYCPAGLAELSLEIGGRTKDLSPAVASPLIEIGASEAAADGVASFAITARSASGDRAELAGEASPEAVALGGQRKVYLELDAPASVGGAAVRVGGLLELRGWALARAGVDSIAVLLDGAKLGAAELGLRRPDVQAAHAGQPDALHSGFGFSASLRAVPNGEHELRLIVRDRAGAESDHVLDLLVEKPYAALRTQLGEAERSLYSDVVERLGAHAVMALVMRQRGAFDAAAAAALEATLASLRAQLHARWRLTLVADAPDAAAERRRWLAAEHPDLTPRVAVVDASDTRPADEPVGVGDGLAPQLEAVDLIGAIRAGDVLGCDALVEFAIAHALHPDAALLYADDIRINPASGAAEPFFKPDFSPELLLSTDYVGRPWFAIPHAIDPGRRTCAEFLAGGEYDALLRATERSPAIRHIPRLLCDASAAPAEAPGDAAALEAASARRGFPSAVEHGAVPNSFRLRRELPARLVSVIVPTRWAGGLVERCLETLRATTIAANVEIIVLDTNADEPPERRAWLARRADHVVEAPGPFNWSRLNNEGARQARGDLLLFLNDDVAADQPGWLDAMLQLAVRPEVGVVGPRLLYPDGTVQHAGMFLATMGLARHAFRHLGADEPGYFGLARTQRDVTAVTGACMLVRREVFDALGGFDEAHAVINNDLDFCLRAGAAGHRVVFTPHATLTHDEGASRKSLPEDYDREAFSERWRGVFEQGDPFHNPNLARETDDMLPDEEPVRAFQGGRPPLERADIRRILAVKLDHIGDVMTALPALRLLRRRFPAARITLLAPRAARAIAEGESSVDAFIAFDFYSARSQDGALKLGPDDFAALKARLAPHRFDLAIDLRKHPDTRDVLRHVPARRLAGFDDDGRFPFLDVALEWASDRPLRRKRGHVSEDLLALVETVAQACRAPDPGPPGPVPDAAAIRGLLPPDAAALWERPVVAVHPGVGNVTRQWPEAHFSELIDLLIALNDVNVVLVGSADEQEVADAVLARVARPERVASLVGRTSIAELQAILPHCALFVGNNSGPHHMAAALGVPTVGVHSGVVDAVEWAPIGPRAIALQKQMTCGPCYIATASQCPRELACLRLLSPATVHRHAETLMARPRRASERQAPPQCIVSPPSITQVWPVT
jgi:ADP-heptose:LPS heptosyltransferase/GT2 family glycosyltransferase